MENHWLAVKGVTLAAAETGIRYQGRDDLVLITLPESAVTAAVFTKNRFCAAPVVVAKKHLSGANPKYLMINSGNANAGTGETGLRAVNETCRLLAGATGVAMDEILPFSTGVIGEDLPIQPFAEGIPLLLQTASEQNWPQAAKAIMTTDTVEKLVTQEIKINGKPVVVTGMAKGSGMIHPNMATMLAFIVTDAVMDKATLQTCLDGAVKGSFNAITVDGDTSTNDACVLVAAGSSGVVIEKQDTEERVLFEKAVNAVCRELAYKIVQDAEGATKLVHVIVKNAETEADAKTVANTVALSPLVKTALFASDPNWGRILAAVGRADISQLDIDNVSIWLDDVCIVSHGGRHPDYDETHGKAVFDRPEFSITIDLGVGEKMSSVMTSDLSFDYVKINAEYRT